MESVSKKNQQFDNPFPPLTPEEVRTLRECNRQAFYNRCLPLSGLGMLALGYGMSAGYVRKNFAIGKIIGVGFLGYVLGKISYISKCRDMILSLPESPLAEKIKKNEQGNYQDMMKEIAVFPTFDESSKNKNIDKNRDNSYDRFERYKGLDESLRPSLDNELKIKTPIPESGGSGTSGTSYEELRNRNRLESGLVLPKTSTQPTLYTHPSSADRSPYNKDDSSSFKQPSAGRATQNRYGDVVIE